ncbi:hypothetical protein HK104_008159, partial [Borealophlyctis nickersoniae]
MTAEASRLPSLPTVDLPVELGSAADVAAPERINLSDMDATRYAVFGSLFILAVDSTLFPLDTIKTVIMSERGVRQGSVPRMVMRMARTEAMYYTAYESAQDMLAKLLPKMGWEHHTFLRGFIADVVKKVFASEGPRGFYRGYLAYIGAYGPASAVQWGSYEFFKGFMYKFMTVLERTQFGSFGSNYGVGGSGSSLGGGGGIGGGGVDTSASPGRIMPHKDHLVNGFSGGLAGLCAVCANNPLEVLRVRHQLLESRSRKDAELVKGGYWNLARSILGEEGWK